jgi:hypothetical protein
VIEWWVHGQDVRVGAGLEPNLQHWPIFLTNDMGITPLNIVMKLVRCNGQPVAKLSDTPGKTLCKDETFLAYLRQVFERP